MVTLQLRLERTKESYFWPGMSLYNQDRLVADCHAGADVLPKNAVNYQRIKALAKKETHLLALS